MMYKVEIKSRGLEYKIIAPTKRDAMLVAMANARVTRDEISGVYKIVRASSPKGEQK